MYLFECEATLEAEPAAVWAVWTDVARWPEWDVSKEIARLDGPFEPGVSGWAKQRGNLGGSFIITTVEAGRRWVSECPVPLGKVVFDHVLESGAKGRVRVVKKVDVEGGITPLIRLFVPRMRRDVAESLAALGRLAATTPMAGLASDNRVVAFLNFESASHVRDQGVSWVSACVLCMRSPAARTPLTAGCARFDLAAGSDQPICGGFGAAA